MGYTSKEQFIESSSRELRRATQGGVPTALIEQLKHVSQIEHSRHRSPINFVVNLLAGLIAYYHRSKKPFIAVDDFVLSAYA